MSDPGDEELEIADGQTLACPRCDSAGDLYERRLGWQASDDKRFRCTACKTSFDEPVVRDRRPLSPIGPRTAAGKALMEMDPSEGWSQ